MPKSFYEYPALYDAVHLPDTPGEMRALLEVAARHRKPLQDFLEPACGTGRNLAFLATLGLAGFGYDLSRRALAFARRGRRAARGSMTSYRGPASAYDCAFSLIGTFRHLLSERDALAHLRLTARALRPGGVYVLGLDLADYDDCWPDEEGWEVSVRGRKVRHLYETLPPDRRRRRERIVNFVVVETARGERVLQDEQVLRSYDLAQWKSLLAKSPFRLAGTYTQEGRRVRLSAATRYALFVLQRR